jgi:hypothetical protein
MKNFLDKMAELLKIGECEVKKTPEDRQLKYVNMTEEEVIAFINSQNELIELLTENNIKLIEMVDNYEEKVQTLTGLITQSLSLYKGNISAKYENSRN